jgi:hypothetical protein
VKTEVKGVTALERKKEGDNASWTYANPTEPKNKENPHGRFDC